MQQRRFRLIEAALHRSLCEMLEPRAYLSVSFSSTVSSLAVIGARAPVVSGFFEGPAFTIGVAVATPTTVQILANSNGGGFIYGGAITLPANPATESPFLSGNFVGRGADIVTLSETSGNGVVTYWSGDLNDLFSQSTTSAITDNGAGFTPISGVVGDFAEDNDLAIVGKPGSGSQLVLAIMANESGSFDEIADYPITDSNALGTITDEQVLTANGNIYINDGSSHHIDVFLGNGDGTFTQATPVNFDATLIAEGQFTDSGNEDLVAVNGSQLTLLEGAGDGTFSAQTPITLGGAITAMHDGDVDRDGNADIVTNQGILLGNGDGTFQPVVAAPAAIGGSAGNASDTAELVSVTGNGKLDLVGIAASGNAVLTVLNTSLAPTSNSLDSNDVTNPDTLSDGSAFQGDDVDFIATVTPDDDSLDFTPTGTVEFFDAGTELGTAPMQSDETATFDAGTALSQGVHPITAEYLGDGNFATSTATEFDETILPPAAATTTTIAPSANPSALGSDLQFTATVSGSDGNDDTPSGNVEFFDGANDLGGADLSDSDTDGVATATFDAGTTLALGGHTITADYQGDENFAVSDSMPLSQTISPDTITTSTSLSTVPTSIVTGTVHIGTMLVHITNDSSTTDQGFFQVKVYATTDGLIDDSAVPVGHVKAFRVIGTGATRFVPILVILPKTLTAGDFTLLAQVTDPLSNVGTSTTGPTLVASAPFIDLSAVASFFRPLSQEVLPGRTYTLAVKVTNNGNIPADGPLPIDLSFSTSSDGSDPIVLAPAPEILRLGVGRHTTFYITRKVAVGTVPDSYFATAQIDPNNTFNDTDLSDNTSTTLTALTVLDPYPVLLDTEYSGTFHVTRGPDRKDVVNISLDFTSEDDTTGAVTADGVETIFNGDQFDFSFVGTISPTKVFKGKTSNTDNSDVDTYLGNLVAGDELIGVFSNTDGDGGTFKLTLTV